MGTTGLARVHRSANVGGTSRIDNRFGWRVRMPLGPNMKKRVVIAIFACLLLVGLGVILPGRFEPDPKNLAYWVRAGGDKDWSVEAAQGKPEAQFFLGLALVRTNLVTEI